MAKGSLKKRRICVVRTSAVNFSFSQRASADWSWKPASITQQSLHRFNGGLSDSRNTGRRWVFKKLARFSPRVGSFNSMSVFLARPWTHEYFPLPSAIRTNLSLLSLLVRSPTLWARPRAYGTLRRSESLIFFFYSSCLILFSFRQPISINFLLYPCDFSIKDSILLQASTSLWKSRYLSWDREENVPP